MSEPKMKSLLHYSTMLLKTKADPKHYKISVTISAA